MKQTITLQQILAKPMEYSTDLPTDEYALCDGDM